jgi:hypothetical protein
MLPRDSNAYAERSREAACVARAILEGKRGICDGCRALTKLAHDLVPESALDPDFVVFVGVDSETEGFPLGDVRRRWHPGILAGLDAEREDFEERMKPRVTAACLSVAARFGAA